MATATKKSARKVGEMTQAEVWRLTPLAAEALVKSVFPDAKCVYINGINGRGYSVRCHPRIGIGYNKSPENAWKSAASRLWELNHFHPNEMPKPPAPPANVAAAAFPEVF